MQPALLRTLRLKLRAGVSLGVLAVGAPALAAPGSCPLPAAAEVRGATPAAEAVERGNRSLAAGEPSAALDSFEVGKQLALHERNAGLAVLADVSAARAEADLGRADASRARLGAALERLAEHPDPALRARVELHAARSLVRLGDARRAASLLTSAAGAASEVEDWRLYSYAMGYLAELYADRGRHAEALELAQQALFWAERIDAPDARYRWHWLLGRIQQGLGRNEAALDAYRQSAATLRGTPELGSADTLPLYESLVELLLARASEVESEAGRQGLLAEARNALEDLNTSELRDYFRDPCLDARRKATPDSVPGALVIYPILLEDRTVLIESFEGEFRSHSIDVGREELVAELRAFRTALEDRTRRSYLRHADRLYRWLITPLEPALAAGRVQTLVFVPRGALNTVPLAALLDREAREFLIEKVPLAVTPSLTLTEPRPIDRESVRVLASGVSDSVQGYPGLEFVREEIQQLSELLPGATLLNRDFVAASFVREVEQQPFDVVHVASHGEFSADASESFVLTYDGRISMNELAALVGRTRFRDRSLELLTLSACETAAGDDRAALGLAGVALNAGARSALATLWAVNDQVSAELMGSFYQHLVDPQHSRAEALRLAQLGVLKQRAFSHPAYWAPYLLISSWL